MKKTEEKIFVFCESFSSQSISQKENEKRFFSFSSEYLPSITRKTKSQNRRNWKKETERKGKKFFFLKEKINGSINEK